MSCDVSCKLHILPSSSSHGSLITRDCSMREFSVLLMTFVPFLKV